MAIKKKPVLIALSALAILAGGLECQAVPAKRGDLKYTTSDGNSITVRMFGDEHHHYFTSTDGYVLSQTESGDFNYANVVNGKVFDTGIAATDVEKRPGEVKKMLASFDKKMAVNAMVKKNQDARMLKAASRVADEYRLSTFPRKGSPKLLCILVQFQDVKFTLKDPYTAFKNQLTQPGYSDAGATGSILDYFTESSNGQFTPQLDLYGPVTLPKNMAYYGGNYNGGDGAGNDMHPQEIVPEACALLDDTVDFTQYDTDNDGIIDNVYIFYAGYGEADGGPQDSIWPHSWDMTEASSYEYYFDGKLLNHYACSNELRDGSGSLVAGIGVFTHEFSHVMGLPDLYSTTQTSAFTPNSWSLMDYGSYNNGGRTPPTHTAYERYCLGWVEPKVLTEGQNVTMRSMTHIGHYDDVYMIKTPSRNEYYILENRQQAKWDQYIPSHGMLVWHIDFAPDIWNLNIVNIAKQHVDIVEADNDPDWFSIEGDPFPGTKNVTAFTDATTPSMITWSGAKLYSPITEIKENNGVITFMFKGGEDIFDAVVAKDAVTVKAGGFTASWNTVAKANNYLLSVYTKRADGTQIPVDEYTMHETGNVTEFEVKGLVPSTTYYYTVRASDGKFFSKPSNEIRVQTLDPTIDYKTVVAKPATDVKATSFKAHWNALEEAENYTLTVYTAQLGDPYTEKADFTGNQLPEGWATDSKTFDSRAAYSCEVPSIRLADAQEIVTATYKQDVRTVDFWYRSNSSAEDNSLDVMGKFGNEWVVIKTVCPVANVSGGAKESINEIPAGCRQIKIVFHRPTTGYVFVDDITIGYGGDVVERPLAEYTDLEVGNVTEYLVEKLTPGATYSYSVIAHKDDLQSKESARISVKLPQMTGITAVEDQSEPNDCRVVDGQIVVTAAADCRVVIYDMRGFEVAAYSQEAGVVSYGVNASGLYIVKVGADVFKVRVVK